MRRPSWTASKLVPRACTCRRPARSDRVVEKRRALRPARAVSGPRADRLRTWLALPRRGRPQGPGCADSGHRCPCASRRRAPDQKQQVKQAPEKRERKSTRARQNSQSGKRTGPEQRGEAERREGGQTNRPCTSLLYPAYANIWITEARWAEPRSPVGRKKRGREPPWIQTFAYTVQPFP